jgi:Na+/H+ antiporter NhaC
VFGDHCSPISDTTIMSSMASTADHVDHVRTQLPYALTVAAVSVLLGYVPAALGLPLPAILALCAGATAGAIFLFGKKVVPDRVAREG